MWGQPVKIEFMTAVIVCKTSLLTTTQWQKEQINLVWHKATSVGASNEDQIYYRVIMAY